MYTTRVSCCVRELRTYVRQSVFTCPLKNFLSSLQQYKASIIYLFADNRVWCASSHVPWRQKEVWCMMWVCLLLVIFGFWDPTIIGSRPDMKKLLLFAATRLQLMESTRGASSADRSSILQMNDTNLRKNAIKNRFFSKTAPINVRAVATNKYLIWDKWSTWFSDFFPIWTPIAFLDCSLPVETLFQAMQDYPPGKQIFPHVKNVQEIVVNPLGRQNFPHGKTDKRS